MSWTLNEGAAMCRLLEGVAPQYGYHVALTGGVLYKDGKRKDLDILFYRIRQTDTPGKDGLLTHLQTMGFILTELHGWVQKATWGGLSVDLFFPDHQDVYQMEGERREY